MTVLVVEDDPDQLMIRAMLFRQSGFHVVEAVSGAAAMEAALITKLTCAVLDLRLPTEAEGLELIRNLKSAQPAVRIFVLTGSQSATVSSMPELALADGVFPKGCSIAALLENLNALAGTPQDEV